LLNIQWVVRMSEELGGGLAGLREDAQDRSPQHADEMCTQPALRCCSRESRDVGLVGHSRVRNIAVAILLAIVATGLWITGSRVAIALGGVAAVIVLVMWGIRSFNRRTAIAGAGAIAIAAGVWLALLPSVRYSTTSVYRRSLACSWRRPVLNCSAGRRSSALEISRLYEGIGSGVSPEMVQLHGLSARKRAQQFHPVLADARGHRIRRPGSSGARIAVRAALACAVRPAGFALRACLLLALVVRQLAPGQWVIRCSCGNSQLCSGYYAGHSSWR
jgi:hypothetical protein